jgi:hypothetical protein
MNVEARNEDLVVENARLKRVADFGGKWLAAET